MGIRRVRLQRRIRYVHARHDRRHAAAGERRQMRARLPHDGQGERLRLYGVWEAMNHDQQDIVDLETLSIRQEGAVLFADSSAPPMNLLGTELVRDLVSLIQRAEADDACQVIVFTSADRDYFISHVDVTRIHEYGEQAARLTGEPSIGILFRYL